MKNYSDIEKSIKRFLKRKVKITLGTIVAFLLGGSLSFADSLYIRDKENGIEFSTDNDFYHDENPYSENSYINNIYINNKNLDGEYGFVNSGSGISIVNNGNINSDYIGFTNIQDDFIGMVENITNKGEIKTGSLSSGDYNIVTGFFNKDGQIKNFVNDSLIQAENHDETANGLHNSNGYIENLINNGKIVGNGNGEGTGIKNADGTIDKIENNGEIQGYSQLGNSYGITNIEGTIGKIINNNIISSIGNDESIGISNFNSEDNDIIGKIGYIENNGEIKVESSKGVGIYNQGEIEKIKNNETINIGVNGTLAVGIDNLGIISNIENNGIFKIKNENSNGGNSYGIGIRNGSDGIITELDNGGEITIESGDKAWGIDNSGSITILNNNGIFKVTGKNNTTGIGNYNGTIGNLTNRGVMNIESLYGNVWGIDNSGEITKLENNGIFDVIGGSQAVGIGNYGKITENLINNGTMKIETNSGNLYGINTSKGNISGSLINNGIIETLNNDPNEMNGVGFSWILNNYKGTINDIINTGIVKGKGKFVLALQNDIGQIDTLENKGIFSVDAYYGGHGISNMEKGVIKNLINSGIIDVKSEKSAAYGISSSYYSPGDTKDPINKLINRGIIKSVGDKDSFGIVNKKKDVNSYEELTNEGIVYSSSITVDWQGGDIATNNGLLIGDSSIFINNSNSINNGMMFSYDKGSQNYKIYGVKESSGNDNIVNATLLGEENKGNSSNWIATGSESIALNGENKENMIFNGITDTLKVSGENTLTDSKVNGYTSAIIFDDNGGKLTLNNSIINGGLDEVSATIYGRTGTDNLTLENNSIINGDINLGEGTDKLTIDNTVQLNGNLDGGAGMDTLNFGLETSSENKNLNILHNISGFENISVNSDVTLFEDIKVTDAGNITIEENGNLVLRIDGTNGNSHALKDNEGVISSTGGKLLFALNGVGEGSIIELGDTKLNETMNGNEGGVRDLTLDTTSLLHNIEKINSNSVKVSTVENIPYVDTLNYNELNKIYQSLRSVDKVGSFNVDNDKKLTAFTKYLHDIYVANPYAYSAELSRKTMGMMRDIADKDLHPDLKEWAIFGGLTHIDGGTEESYYGKGDYSYDIGSRDISADTKITGAYVKGEYGKAEDLTLGIILGGNSSETEIESSKVEGDSFYLGGYAKKYLNNFRFTLGAGIHRGDYEADRVAVGYDGISETRKFSENYGDRGFNLYGNIKYSQELGNGFYFEPSITLDYSYVDQEGVKESGDLAIDIDSEKFEYTSGIANLDIRKEFVGEKAKHSLIAGVSYERILSGEDEKHITGRFKGGTDFDILVPEKEKDNFALNVKYEVETEKGILFDVKGSYKFEHDSNKDQWIVGTGIGYKF